ncbi:MAG: hypothetical protein M1818_006292 [Claussenomyces sp. TS43310]|nr:MAG: hypothetical protein M1818_006292 [Claussenomyces sp. TS43310]
MDSSKYIPYGDDVEQPAADEQASIDGIIKAMTGQSETAAKREHGHAVRASHAKSTGLLTGTLEVHSNEPALAQGLFSKPGTYPVAVRFAQGPGELLNDRVGTHRGMSIKVFGVEGPKLKGHTVNNQDFVLSTGPTFPSGTAAGFLRDEKMLQTATPMPEVFKSAVSSIARTANSVSEAVTGAPSPLADFFGHPFTHPLSEPYYSQCPIRFGDYVAKLGAFPVGANMQKVQKVRIDTSKDGNAFRKAVVEHFAEDDYTFEIRAQLWTSKDTQSIEDASIQWSEDESPYQTIATVRIPKQAAYSPERQRYFDEVMIFRPAHSLEVHKPLGSIMRTRLQVYSALSDYRHKQNGVKEVNPAQIEQIPA